jgi:hypothetical protein
MRKKVKNMDNQIRPLEGEDIEMMGELMPTPEEEIPTYEGDAKHMCFDEDGNCTCEGTEGG